MAVNVGTAMAYLDLDLTPFKSGLMTARTSLLTFLDSTQSATNRVAALGTAFTSVGSTLTTGLTLPIAALGTAVVTTAANFESSMSRVEAISGATADDMERLTEKAIEMGAKTKFSAKESADAFTYMAMAGWKTEDMLQSIDGIMNLAAADGLDLATTSDIVTDAMTAFGLAADGTTTIIKDGFVKEVSNASHFADVLARASTNANTNVSMLGESFKYVAPVAGAFGFSVEDTSIALGLMANSGIKASQAGTSLRQTFLGLQGGVELVGDSFGKWWIEVENSDGTMRNLLDIIVDLREAFSHMTESEKAMNAETIANKTGMSGLLAIVNASEKDFEKLSSAIYNADGAAEEMAEIMLDNLPGAITLLKSALETLMINLGNALIPTIRSITEGITKVIEFLGKLSEEQINQIVKIAAIVAAIGPVLLIIGKVITGISSLMSVISELASPVGIIITLIAGIIAVLINLYQTNENFRNGINEVWQDIQETIASAVENIKQLWEGLQPALELLKQSFESIKEQLGQSLLNVIESLKQAFISWQPIIELIAQVLGTVLLTAISLVTGAINGFIQALVPLIDILVSIISIVGELGRLIVAVFTGDFETAKQSISTIFEQILLIFQNALGAIGGFLSGFWEGFVQTMDSLFAAFGVEGIGRLLEDFKTKVIEIVKSIGKAISDFVTVTIPNFFKSIIEWFKSIPEKFKEFAQQVKQWFSNLVNTLTEFITVTIPDFFNRLEDWFSKLPYLLGYYLGLAIGKLIQFGVDAINWVITEVPKIIDNIVKFFAELPGKVWNWLVETYNKLVEWAKNMINKIVEWAAEMLDKFSKWASDMIAKTVEWSTNFVKEAGVAAKGFIDKVIEFISTLPEKLKEWFNKAVETILGFKDSMIEAGKAIFNGLWDGLKSVWDGISDWIEGIGKKIKDFFQGIWDGITDATNAMSGLSVNGSHANGLSYVPYNGYIAELHEGERVLTKKENEDYNNNQSKGGDTYIFYTDQPIDEYEAAKQLKRAKREMELDY